MVTRWVYLALLFVWFRARFYSAWILAECMAVTAGLGAYPSSSINRSGAGPTDLQGDHVYARTVPGVTVNIMSNYPKSRSN